MRKYASTGALVIVMLLWGFYLGYPMHRLQNIRWTLLGYAVPAYYFFNALLIAMPAAFVLIVKRHWSRWELFWWALPLICVPGILFSDDPVWSVRQCLSWMIRGVIPGGIIFLIANQKKAKSMFLFWIYPIVIAASLLGLLELYSGNNLFWDGLDPHIPATAQAANPFYRPGDAIPVSQGARGTQGNRIPYTAIVVAFLPMGLWLLKYEKRFYLVHFFMVGIMGLLLFLAQVRSAWIGALAVLFLICAVGLRRNLREVAVFVAATIACFVFLFIWPRTHGMLSPRLESFHFSESSIRQRLAALETITVLKKRWLLGVGFGQFPTACRPYYHSDLPWSGTPDDQYLRWAIENGIPSLILLAAFLVGIIRAAWKKIGAMGDVRQEDFYKSLLVGWGGIAVTFLFFDGFYWGACNMTFWCLLGLFAGCLSSTDGQAVIQKP
jgi:hypothetical protein